MFRSRSVLCILAAAAAFLTIDNPAALGQSLTTQSAMHARVRELYNFSPHAVTDAVRQSKSAEMDAFWNEIKGHAALELPLLRAELADTSNPPFFMMDGTNLLLSLSHAPADQALAAVALSRADLADVTPSAYFFTVHALSMSGCDTTHAALHILDDPKFAVPLPQHAMVLDKGSSLMYLLLPVAPEKWLPAGRERFQTDKDEATQKSLLALFFYLQTPKADSIIRQAATDPAKSPAVHKDAQEYLADAKTALTQHTTIQGTEAEIRERRRQRLAAVSDESIDDVQEMTVRLIQLRHGHGTSSALQPAKSP